VTRQTWTVTEEFNNDHGIHAFVRDETTERTWEVLIRPVYVPGSAFGVRLLQGWEWLIDGHHPPELGEPMSRDDAWDRALHYITEACD
jgi:hypothetical protein